MRFYRSEYLSTAPEFTILAQVPAQVAPRRLTRVCTDPFPWRGQHSFRAVIVQDSYQPQEVIRNVGMVHFENDEPQPISLEIRNPLDTTQVISLTHSLVGLPKWQVDMPSAVTLGPGEAQTVDVTIRRPQAHAATLAPPPGDEGYVDIWTNTADGLILGGARLQVWEGPIRRIYMPLMARD